MDVVGDLWLWVAHDVLFDASLQLASSFTDVGRWASLTLVFVYYGWQLVACEWDFVFEHMLGSNIRSAALLTFLLCLLYCSIVIAALQLQPDLIIVHPPLLKPSLASLAHACHWRRQKICRNASAINAMKNLRLLSLQEVIKQLQITVDFAMLSAFAVFLKKLPGDRYPRVTPHRFWDSFIVRRCLYAVHEILELSRRYQRL